VAAPAPRPARGALPPRWEIEPPAVVSKGKREPVDRFVEPHPKIVRACMPQHVRDGFLCDAKAGCLGVRGDVVTGILGIEMRRETRYAALTVEVRAQRRGEAEIVEL